MKNSGIRNANIRSFTAPFLVITLIGITTLIFIGNSIKDYYYELKRAEALKLAKNISIHLSHTGELLTLYFHSWMKNS